MLSTCFNTCWCVVCSWPEMMGHLKTLKRNVSSYSLLKTSGWCLVMREQTMRYCVLQYITMMRLRTCLIDDAFFLHHFQNVPMNRFFDSTNLERNWQTDCKLICFNSASLDDDLMGFSMVWTPRFQLRRYNMYSHSYKVSPFWPMRILTKMTRHFFV